VFEIEILRPGEFTSDDGRKVDLSVERLRQVVASYNPRKFRAPLIISHNTQGVPDDSLVESELAYGTPSRLTMDSRGRVKALFDKVAPQFLEWVRNKQLLSVSASLYPPGHPNNPYKTWSLRHVAALGSTPPAIKGLAPLTLSEWDSGQIGCIRLSEFADHRPRTRHIYGQQLKKRMNETGIEAIGLAEALGVSTRMVESWLDGRTTPRPQHRQLIETIFEPADGSVAAELQLAIARVTARDRAAQRRDIENFAETIYNEGRLVPGIVNRNELVDFMVCLQNETVQLGEKSHSKIEWFQSWLKKLPKIVSFGESVTNWQEAGDSSPVSLAERIRQYQNEHHVDVITALQRLKNG
jgi:DNA-binding transcriptional regulator YiaG